ncbi:MAG: lipid-A-disaccharide synthase N-terminal domain-containing protein [Kiritimatiellales bacterium]|nr:lipid-A-disaccharide synthase N-terminal domain-containing protein [Kiritimatiellales bacterium]MCF7864439.1 lipid-A-disaccharide synthase N-terminal domain-containing protein [Kiritimatiellales bacterium]
MHETLLSFFGVNVTGWKLVGYAGILMFTSRWFVQLWYSKRAGHSVMPRLFWVMSIAGSLLCLLYFTFGKNDSVGIISYVFPMCVAGYNLSLDLRHSKRKSKDR